MSYAGALREVREELAPKVPELAQELSFNEFAICEAIYAALANDNVNVRTIPEIDWIKTEQHTITAWGGGIMRRNMVDGDDRKATFKPGVLRVHEIKDKLPGASAEAQLAAAVDWAIYDNARDLLRRYTDGDNPEGLRIIPALSERYMDLGYRRQDLIRERVGAIGLANESLSLFTGLSSKTLAPEVGNHLAFINQRVQGDTTTKLAAAHDTSFLPYGLAAHNVHEFGSASDALRRMLDSAAVVQDASAGRYVVKSSDGQPFRPPRDQIEALDTTLKCPLRVDGNLAALIGASINAAELFGVFESNQES